MNAQSGFLTAKPTNAFATPLEFNIIEMDKFAVALDDTTSQWSMDIAMKISLRWSDFRLADVSCRAKLSEMLSLIPGSTAAVRTEREADRVLIWMPTLELNGSAISYKPDLNAIGAGSTRNEVSASSFAYDEAATAPFMSQGPDVVSSGNTTGSPSTCLHCSQLNLTFTWSLGISPRLSYTNYPFDSQSFKLRFAFGIDSDVFSCESLISDADYLPSTSPSPAGSRSFFAQLASQGLESELLPAEYKFARSNGIIAAHPVLPNGAIDRSICDITLNVERSWFIVFLKIIFPSVLIVYLGLCSVFLSASDHSGDRAALLGVSILISMINLERDLGLGKLMYATWFDEFNIVQLGVQVIALLEGLLEHKFICWGLEAECLCLNKIWAMYVMLIMYPVVTTAVLLKGAGQETAYISLVGGLLPVFTILAIWEFFRRLSAGKRKRLKLAKKLSETDKESPRFLQLFQEAFEAFDLDGSGELDTDETRTLLKAIFGKNKEVYALAMDTSRKIAAGKGISLPALEEVFDTLALAGHMTEKKVGSQRQVGTTSSRKIHPEGLRKKGLSGEFVVSNA